MRIILLDESTLGPSRPVTLELDDNGVGRISGISGRVVLRRIVQARSQAWRYDTSGKWLIAVLSGQVWSDAR